MDSSKEVAAILHVEALQNQGNAVPMALISKGEDQHEICTVQSHDEHSELGYR
ncbi:hypothetical protein [Paenibacillus shirakamiensis]|uniref:hypothetical protein n=1 Tax=Paenibacillus shirakamiensis TaxID=1265935 RepID=UPI001AE33A57|nr:hypothetical protein [Paenibacillus shirakamiensis]